MRSTMDNSEFAKIFVQSYECTTLQMGIVQNLVISGILRPTSSPNHVMSSGLKRVANGTGNARVDK
jgi:hypothetical protein